MQELGRLQQLVASGVLTDSMSVYQMLMKGDSVVPRYNADVLEGTGKARALVCVRVCVCMCTCVRVRVCVRTRAVAWYCIRPHVCV